MSVKSTPHSTQPIGIFDSGAGGLTTAYAVSQLLPDEKIIYFGDNAHHPYGEKSVKALQHYSDKICDFLLKQQCKLILIACHSASTASLAMTKKYTQHNIDMINVIDPVMTHLQQHYQGKTLGLIGTKQTVNSGVYHQKISALKADITLKSFATPLLAPMIEEGYAGHTIIDAVLQNYLSQPVLNNIEGLLLACTHYPLIKPQIHQFYKDRQHPISLIDSAEVTANAVKKSLENRGLLNTSAKTAPPKFYISDFTQSFVENARHFFPDTLNFEVCPLWE